MHRWLFRTAPSEASSLRRPEHPCTTEPQSSESFQATLLENYVHFRPPASVSSSKSAEAQNVPSRVADPYEVVSLKAQASNDVRPSTSTCRHVPGAWSCRVGVPVQLLGFSCRRLAERVLGSAAGDLQEQLLRAAPGRRSLQEPEKSGLVTLRSLSPSQTDCGNMEHATTSCPCHLCRMFRGCGQVTQRFTCLALASPRLKLLRTQHTESAVWPCCKVWQRVLRLRFQDH